VRGREPAGQTTAPQATASLRDFAGTLRWVRAGLGDWPPNLMALRYSASESGM
jgi:hypothetical protein